ALLSLFTLWAALSALWSPNPTLSVAKACELWLTAVAAIFTASVLRLSFASRSALIDILTLVFVVTLGMLVLANTAINGSPLSFSEYLPGRGRLYLAYAHPLGIGDLSALAMICIFVSDLRKIIKVVSFSAFSIILLLTDSRAALAAVAAALFSMLLIRSKGKGLLILAAITSGVLIGGFLYSDSLRQDRSRGSLGASIREDADTLNGRTDLWRYAWGLIQERPFFGYGYYSTRFYTLSEFPWAGAMHNAYIETQFTLGLPGSVLFLLFTSYVISVARRTRCRFWSVRRLYCYIRWCQTLLFTPGVPMFILLVSLMNAAPPGRDVSPADRIRGGRRSVAFLEITRCPSLTGVGPTSRGSDSLTKSDGWAAQGQSPTPDLASPARGPARRSEKTFRTGEGGDATPEKDSRREPPRGNH
ncbi:MAG: O-antigen ligase family protein, partial [Singulisphaera sp.]